jgi:plasmid replication initiation protein
VAYQQTHVDWNELIALARELPARLAAAYAHEREQIHTLHANQQEETVGRLIDFLVSMWTSLAFWYPPGHFNGEDPEAFFRDYLADRFAWRSLLVHESTHNPIQALEIKRAVLSDAEDAVADTVAAIFRGNDRVMLNLWDHRWSEARSLRDRFPQ